MIAPLVLEVFFGSVFRGLLTVRVAAARNAKAPRYLLRCGRAGRDMGADIRDGLIRD
jgi:hypothetical protein